MSHFYGTLTGCAKTTATRRGHKSTGIRTVAASWAGAIEVELEVCPEPGHDYYIVRMIP